MSMWPSKININQKDGVLSESATQDEILNALLLWDMPLEAYPKEILSAKLVWYIPQPGVDDITVDVQLQAFVVPHSDGNYYSFWNKDELPLGSFTLIKSKNGKIHHPVPDEEYTTGYNHTSATLAWVDAKEFLQRQYKIALDWNLFQGFHQVSRQEKYKIKNKKCYDGRTIDVGTGEPQQQQQQQQWQSPVGSECGCRMWLQFFSKVQNVGFLSSHEIIRFWIDQ